MYVNSLDDLKMVVDDRTDLLVFFLLLAQNLEDLPLFKIVLKTFDFGASGVLDPVFEDRLCLFKEAVDLLGLQVFGEVSYVFDSDVHDVSFEHPVASFQIVVFHLEQHVLLP